MGRQAEEVQDFGLQAHQVAARAPDRLGIHGRPHTGTPPRTANKGAGGDGESWRRHIKSYLRGSLDDPWRVPL